MKIHNWGDDAKQAIREDGAKTMVALSASGDCYRIPVTFFWLIACCLSLYYCTLFIIESWKVVHSNPISFVVDTNYLNWNTSFPAVSVCEQENNNVFKLADEIFGEEHDYNLDEVIREMAFFRGNLYYTVNYCDESSPCPTNGLEEIAKKVYVIVAL
ncbi:hypothetical protein J437_LFUL012879 [Ladona fulva]|uniref:Uncharacterized protein n=1 Tax=Ladona fulva TaxID=123851 RepID=A0A8K0JZV5_LADFU|nr:hypothetical protein J437_LFUL012879 [Ladona fulva]